jgi:hypothetical protein
VVFFLVALFSCAVLLFIVNVFFGGAFQCALAKHRRIQNLLVIVLVSDDSVLVIVEMNDLVKQNSGFVSVLILKLLCLRYTLE